MASNSEHSGIGNRKDSEISISSADSFDAQNLGDGSDISQLNNKHLRMLAFANPGKFMEDFDPERSTREMRKMNRRIYTDTVRKNQAYDEIGRLLTDLRDVCDCLDATCPGCHFPCPKCGSEKCGAECRCSRRWVYQEVEVEGANQKMYFPQS